MMIRKLKTVLFALGVIATLPSISLASNLDCSPIADGTYVGHFETIIHRPDFDTTNLAFQTDTLNNTIPGCVQLSETDRMLNKIAIRAFLNHRDVTITVGGTRHFLTAIAYSINE